MHSRGKLPWYLLLLQLLFVLLCQVLKDSLMGLHQQVVLLIPAAVQCIPLSSQSLVPATMVSDFIKGLFRVCVGIIRVTIRFCLGFICTPSITAL